MSIKSLSVDEELLPVPSDYRQGEELERPDRVRKCAEELYLDDVVLLAEDHLVRVLVVDVEELD